MYTADRTEAMVEDLTAQNWTAADHTEVKSEVWAAQIWTAADRTEVKSEVWAAQIWTAADHTEVKSETENVAAVFADQAFADQAFAAELAVWRAVYTQAVFQACCNAGVQPVLIDLYIVYAEGIQVVGAALQGTVYSELVQAFEQGCIQKNEQAFRRQDRSGFQVQALYRIYHKNQPF